MIWNRPPAQPRLPRQRIRRWTRRGSKVLVPVMLFISGSGIYQLATQHQGTGRLYLETDAVICLGTAIAHLATRMPNLPAPSAEIQSLTLGWLLSLRGRMLRYWTTTGFGAFFALYAVLMWALHNAAPWLQPLYRLTEAALWFSIGCLMIGLYARASMFTAVIRHPNATRQPAVPGQTDDQDWGLALIIPLSDLGPIHGSGPTA